MKTGIVIGILLCAAAAAMAQSHPPAPTELRVNGKDNNARFELTWKAPNFGGPLTYRVIRRRTYADDGIQTYDSAFVTDPIPATKYTDNNPLPCFLYTYWVVAIAQNVNQSPSSDSVSIQNKGGVNAVVIFPVTLKTVAVAGFRFTTQLRACDSHDEENVTFTLSGVPQALQGMTLDSVSGVIDWNVPDGIAPGAYSFVVLAHDEHGGDGRREYQMQVQHSALGRVSGTVSFLPAGTARQTLQLTLHSDDGRLYSATTKSGDSGSFVFEEVPFGAYKLSYALPDRRIVGWYLDAASQDSAKQIVLTSTVSRVTLANIVVTVPPQHAVTIRGRITSVGESVANVNVQPFEVSGFLRRAGASGLPLLAPGTSVQTSADGSFAATVDSGGTYVLLARGAGYHARFLGSGNSSCASPLCAQTFSPVNDTNNVSADLGRRDTTTQQIVGTVTDLADGARGVKAMILLMKSIDGTITSGYSGGLVPFDVVTSDAAGNFQIPSVSLDSTGLAQYMLQAVPYEGYVPAFHAVNDSVFNFLLWENAALFRPDTSSLGGMNIDVHVPALANGTGTISGRVLETVIDGTTASERAYVYAVDQNSLSAAGWALTDVDGNFSIGNLPSGVYELFADKIGFRYALQGEIPIQGSDSARSDGHILVLSGGLSSVGKHAQPMSDALSPAFPNPFGRAAMLHVAASAGATVTVVDVYGRQIADLTMQARSSAGFVVFDGSHVPAGSYFCVLRDQRGMVTRPMFIVH